MRLNRAAVAPAMAAALLVGCTSCTHWVVGHASPAPVPTQTGAPAAPDPGSAGLDTFAFISDWAGTANDEDGVPLGPVRMQVGSTYDPPPPEGPLTGDLAFDTIPCVGYWDEASHDDTQVLATLQMQPGADPLCGTTQTMTLSIDSRGHLLVSTGYFYADLTRSDD